MPTRLRHMDYSPIIAKRIKELLKERGLSANKFATMCGLQRSSVYNCYSGTSTKPSLRTIHAMARAFGMTVSEFLDFDELNNVNPYEESESKNRSRRS